MTLSEAYVAGFIAGLTEFAWWKDGTQFVGSCSQTLQGAIEYFKANGPVVTVPPKEVQKEMTEKLQQKGDQDE